MLPPDILQLVETHRSLLELYVSILKKWQSTINLVSPNTLSNVWTRHILDSAQLVPHLGEAKTIYDIGSGAGFPGLVFAILMPSARVTLIESDNKKCAFLAAVSRETGASVTIVPKRVEECCEILPAPDCVTSRALAPLKTLFDYIDPWAQQNKELKCLFLKGKNFQDEIDAARSEGWIWHHTVSPSSIAADSVIISASDIRRSL